MLYSISGVPIGAKALNHRKNKWKKTCWKKHVAKKLLEKTCWKKMLYPPTYIYLLRSPFLRLHQPGTKMSAKFQLPHLKMLAHIKTFTRKIIPIKNCLPSKCSPSTHSTSKCSTYQNDPNQNLPYQPLNRFHVPFPLILHIPRLKIFPITTFLESKCYHASKSSPI